MINWLKEYIIEASALVKGDRAVSDEDEANIDAHRDKALEMIDELEKAVTLTREWFDKGWWVPVVRSNGQDKVIPPGTIGPKTQAVMDAIKKVTS